MGYTGLGRALLQHLVHYRFLLSSSIFTHYLLNDLAEEQQALFPVTKALLFYTQNQHYFSYDISLSESNLRKKTVPPCPGVIDACCYHGHHFKGQIREGQTITSGRKRCSSLVIKHSLLFI